MPEFGGYSLDPDGRGLRVVLTDPTIDLTAVCASIARHSAGFSVANLMVSPLKGDYGFAELAQWYAQAQDSAFAIDGLVSTDIDEVRNRIVVGAATEDAEAAIAQALGELGIPAEAVVIEHAEPVTLDE